MTKAHEQSRQIGFEESLVSGCRFGCELRSFQKPLIHPYHDRLKFLSLEDFDSFINHGTKYETLESSSSTSPTMVCTHRFQKSSSSLTPAWIGTLMFRTGPISSPRVQATRDSNDRRYYCISTPGLTSIYWKALQIVPVPVLTSKVQGRSWLRGDVARLLRLKEGS